MADEAALPWPTHSVSRDDARTRALEAALPECANLAFRVAYSVLRHRQDAEDVAQEVLLEALRSLRDLRDPERLRPWLVRASFRRALDHQRRRRLERHPNATRESLWPTGEILVEPGQAEALVQLADLGFSGEVALPDSLLHPEPAFGTKLPPEPVRIVPLVIAPLAPAVDAEPEASGRGDS